MSLRPKKVEFKNIWPRIHQAMESILRLDCVSKQDWTDRFYDIYDLCVAYPESHSNQLYKEVESVFEKHTKRVLRELQETASEQLLFVYCSHWSSYRQGVTYLNNLFKYLNSYLLAHNKTDSALDGTNIVFDTFNTDVPAWAEDKKLCSVEDLAMQAWCQQMLEPFHDRLITLVLDAISKDRRGEAQPDDILQTVIRSFVETFNENIDGAINVYSTWFEDRFLDETRTFYTQVVSHLRATLPCSQFMERVLEKMKDEQRRCERFIYQPTHAKVSNVCCNQMVAENLEYLQTECSIMVAEEKENDLRNAYHLLNPLVVGLQFLIKQFEDHVKGKASSAVESVTKGCRSGGAGTASVPQEFVEQMYEVHKKYKNIVEEVFENNKKFMSALDRACSAAINFRDEKSLCKSPEYLAKYTDSLLRKGMKNVSDVDDIENKLSNCITIFKYLDDRDIFQKFYARLFAKRLIYQNSSSMESEESMIKKLRQACGYEFTNKLHRMFTDISLSKDLNDKFACDLEKQKLNLDIGYNLLVLQSGSWPISTTNLPSLVLPSSLQPTVQRFESFYKSLHSGRKLTWIQHLGQVEMKASYPHTGQAPYIITLGVYQCAILEMFNEAVAITYQDLLTGTGMDLAELKKQLQPLLEAKILLVKGEQPEAEMESMSQLDTCSCLILWNENFKSKRLRFRVAQAISKETSQESEQVEKSVNDDRKLFLHAAIVRIMKARKKSKHNILIQEVITQAKGRFIPNVGMIKKSIETLIEKQYLERNTASPDEYLYVA